MKIKDFAPPPVAAFDPCQPMDGRSADPGSGRSTPRSADIFAPKSDSDGFPSLSKSEQCSRGLIASPGRDAVVVLVVEFNTGEGRHLAFGIG
jgi:hypothetical protein